MALFVVRHTHTPDRCPAGDPDMGAMLLNGHRRLQAEPGFEQPTVGA